MESLLNHAPNRSLQDGFRIVPQAGPRSRLCAGSRCSAAWTTEPAGVDPRDPARQWDLSAISPMASLQLQLPLYPNCPRCWGSPDKRLTNSSESLPSFQENAQRILHSHGAEAGPVLSYLLKRKCLPPGKQKQKQKQHPFWLKPAGSILLTESLNSELLAVLSWKSHVPDHRHGAVCTQGEKTLPQGRLFSSLGTCSPTVSIQLGILHADLEQGERLQEKPGDAPGH